MMDKFYGQLEGDEYSPMALNTFGWTNKVEDGVKVLVLKRHTLLHCVHVSTSLFYSIYRYIFASFYSSTSSKLLQLNFTILMYIHHSITISLSSDKENYKYTLQLIYF